MKTSLHLAGSGAFLVNEPVYLSFLSKQIIRGSSKKAKNQTFKSKENILQVK